MLPRDAAVDYSSYSWSLGVIVRWMQLIGVDLGNSVNSLCVFWLVLSITCFSVEFYHMFSTVNDTPESYGLSHSTTTLSANIIDYINWAGENLGCHLALVLVTRNRWRELWSHLTQLNSLISIGESIHRRLHRYCCMGIVYTILMVNVMSCRHV